MRTILITKQHRGGLSSGPMASAHGSRDQWRDHALEELRRAGHRSGGARSAVVDLMARQHCGVTAQEIFDELRKGGKVIGIASVYRALDLLSRMELVHRLDLAEAAYYEPAHPGGEHHHHVVCDRCGKVAQFEDEELEAAIERLAGRLKYSVAAHDVVLRGACPDCKS
jgi:Fur family transcriptional regulator, ferric uptake regulator